MNKRQVDGIEVVAAFDGARSEVFIQLETISINGPFFQSKGLSLQEIDVLIDELIDASAAALAMSKQVAS